MIQKIKNIATKINQIHQEGLLELLNLLHKNEDDPTNCDYCKNEFGFFYYSVRMASYFHSFDQDTGKTIYPFTIRCRKCGKINTRERVK